MPLYQGKFQYKSANGTVTREGAARIEFDSQTFTLTPSNGAAIVFDLGDLDAVGATDWEVRATLYTGHTIVLNQLGKSYENLARELTDAFRNRSVECMLLEDMGEIARFNANVELASPGRQTAPTSGPAEIRLYKSNLAVLPAAARSFQWRLADIDDVKLDADAYEVRLTSGENTLRVTRLAKRTEEFSTGVTSAMNALSTQTSQALHGMFPFLDPDQLQSCASILREGRSALLAQLTAIHKLIPTALAKNAVDKNLTPYYDQLVVRAASGLGYAGFKMIRPEGADGAGSAPSDPDEEEDGTSGAADADSDAPETLYWFLFPLAAKAGSATPANVVAWEASSRSGRATYFFRLVDPVRAGELNDPARAASIVDSSIRRLNTVLAMLNFRRRPIYLSDDELAMDARFHRYAIAARRLSEVREVRASFLGRALHSSPDAWQSQVDSILAKAAR